MVINLIPSNALNSGIDIQFQFLEIHFCWAINPLPKNPDSAVLAPLSP